MRTDWEFETLNGLAVNGDEAVVGLDVVDADDDGLDKVSKVDRVLVEVGQAQERQLPDRSSAQTFALKKINP